MHGPVTTLSPPSPSHPFCFRFWLTRGTLMAETLDIRNQWCSVASYLSYADVRLHIPMTQHNDRPARAHGWYRTTQTFGRTLRGRLRKSCSSGT